MKNSTFLMLVILVSSSLKLVAQSYQYTKEEIASDLIYLKKELKDNHPNLYTYSSEALIDTWFENQIRKTPDLVNERAAFKIVASISSLIKDGHSYIYPSAKHLDDFFNSAPLFPFDVFLVKDQLTVVGDFSNEQNIPLGSIIIDINGVEIAKIESEIINQTCRDGDNMQYPKHLYDHFFTAYYSFLFGFHKTFEIGFLDHEGKLKRVSIEGLTRRQIRGKRPSVNKKGIELKLLPNQESAILTIKSFDKKMLNSEYNQKFKKEIKQIFKKIEEEGIQHVAIDLRGNQGGALSNGVYLLQYFMDSSFQCVHSYFVLKKDKKKRLHMKWDNYFEPKQKYHFNGNVYLFINGGSYSCSSIVANTFKENKRGELLGEMTGGSAYVNSGAPNKVITLPNTGVACTIPKTQYILRKGISEIGQGVIPTVVLFNMPSTLFAGEDNFVNKFLELAKQ